MCGPYRHDSLVLVEDVELMEFPEGVVPTCVWLQSLGEPQSFDAGPAHAFAEPICFEFGGISVERDVSVYQQANQHLAEFSPRQSRLRCSPAHQSADMSGACLRPL